MRWFLLSESLCNILIFFMIQHNTAVLLSSSKIGLPFSKSNQLDWIHVLYQSPKTEKQFQLQFSKLLPVIYISCKSSFQTLSSNAAL